MNQSNESIDQSAPRDSKAGALAGKGAAEGIDPTHEEAYWRDHFSGRPYVESGSSYNDYGPAYGLGVDAFSRNPDRTFDEVEPDMSEQWSAHHSASSLTWERARHAARDAWNRISPSS